MTQSSPVDLSEVSAGHVFSPVSIDLSSERLKRYLDVLEGSETVTGTGASLVPPSAAAAMAMGALLQNIALPLGTLHTSQEIRFHSPLPIGTPTRCDATVSNRSSRGGATFVTLDFSITAEGEAAVVMEATATLLISGGQ